MPARGNTLGVGQGVGFVLSPPRRTWTRKMIGLPNPNLGLSLTLDLRCERPADTWWNFGLVLKKKRQEAAHHWGVKAPSNAVHIGSPCCAKVAGCLAPSVNRTVSSKTKLQVEQQRGSVKTVLEERPKDTYHHAAYWLLAAFQNRQPTTV